MGQDTPINKQTRKLKELFPNVELLDGVPILCPITMEGTTPEEIGCIGKCCSDCKKEYWEGEYVQK